MNLNPEKMRRHLIPLAYAVLVCTAQHYGISLAAAASLVGL